MESKVTGTGGCFRRRLLRLFMVAALLSLIPAAAVQDDASVSSDEWKPIDAYNEAMGAYWTKQSEIRNADVSAEEQERM